MASFTSLAATAPFNPSYAQALAISQRLTIVPQLTSETFRSSRETPLNQHSHRILENA